MLRVGRLAIWDQPERSGGIPALDGLRAIAVALVLVGHGGIPGVGGGFIGAEVAGTAPAPSAPPPPEPPPAPLPPLAVERRINLTDADWERARARPVAAPPALPVWLRVP